MEATTVRTLCARASELTGVDAAKLIARDGTKATSRARHAVAYIAHTKLEKGYTHIGRQLGNRHHATIIESCRRAAELRETNEDFAHLLDEMAQ